MGLQHINVYYVALHRSQNLPQDIRFSVHHGDTARQRDMDSPKFQDGLNAWNYARSVGHDYATWKQKMKLCWDKFDDLDVDFQDALHQYMVGLKPPL